MERYRKLLKRLTVALSVAATVVLTTAPIAGAQSHPEPEPRQVVTHFFVGGTGKIAGLQTVVGNSLTHRVRSSETFLDIARKYDVGYNELVAANPDLDAWVPEVGTDMLVPAEWVLPAGEFEGLVVTFQR